MKKRTSRYNYVRHTLLLDLDNPDDAKIAKWLEKNRTKKNNYNQQIKSALAREMAAPND